MTLYRVYFPVHYRKPRKGNLLDTTDPSVSPYNILALKIAIVQSVNSSIMVLGYSSPLTALNRAPS